MHGTEAFTVAEQQGGHLRETDHLDDQLAALAWLRKQTFVQPGHIAVAGNSFGGVEAVLGAAREPYCATIDASGGAESWALAPELQTLMMSAVRDARAPIFFFQAENDYDLTPSRTLAASMKDAGKPYEIKIYPTFGKTPADGHAFAYIERSVWENDVFHFLQEHCGS